jgi:ABC-type dipeptide/oligopeptide/nickel transport system permease component
MACTFYEDFSDLARFTASPAALRWPLLVLVHQEDDRPLGVGVTGLAILAISLPEFWVGTMLALVFGVKLA